MSRPLITTTEASKILGVGATSVKRWADAGILTCVKTAGGHRRFRLEEVERLIDAQRSPKAPANAAPDPEDEDRQVERFTELLLSDANTYLLQSRLLEHRGHLDSWWRVATIVGRVLAQLGEKWQAGKIRVIEEHMASERLERAISACSSQMSVASNAPRAMLVVADDDEHTLGLALAELCLREAGWNTMWSGKRTPVGDLIDYVEREDLDLLAVSASSWSRPTELNHLLERVGPSCEQRNVHLVLGGTGPWPETPRHGHRVRTFEHFALLLARLTP